MLSKEVPVAPKAKRVIYLFQSGGPLNDILSALEQHLGLSIGAIKTYVLVEQVEACYQLMEIRASASDTLLM